MTHHRDEPAVHGFRRRVWMPMLDLDRVAELRGLWPLWSSRHPALVWHRRSDFGGAHKVSNPDRRTLAHEIRDLVQNRIGTRPEGRLELLAHARTWGWLFNPIAVYYCYAQDGSLVAAVLEVTNTPWGDRHQYVLDLRAAGGARVSVAKQMHVSPFLPVNLVYDIRVSTPGERCALSIAVRQDETVVFSAAMSLRRHAFTRRRLVWLLLRQPFPTHSVSVGIYVHAARLWRKRVPFVPRPSVAGRAAQ